MERTGASLKKSSLHRSATTQRPADLLPLLQHLVTRNSARRRGADQQASSEGAKASKTRIRLPLSHPEPAGTTALRERTAYLLEDSCTTTGACAIFFKGSASTHTQLTCTGIATATTTDRYFHSDTSTRQDPQCLG